MSARTADIVGRYVYLDVEDVEYRVYYEESGAGIPVILQHTAGCDSRQWRHLLEDPDFTSTYRLIAPDVPFHGRSLPPASQQWWTEEYSLTQSFFIQFHLALLDALGLERPIYAGCSMGGHLAPDLALHHPGIYRAVIGIEAALESHGVERILPWLYHPRISNDTKPALMYTLCAPQSPEAFKRETTWVYSQGAPPVFKGDLDYYLVEHDLTETAKTIDTTENSVHVLNGEYDWSAYPAAGQALAEEIDGATYVTMNGVGHFPMSENPDAFKQYFLPLLKQVSEQ
ncbi:alpha/beta hydrolase [Rhodococcus erythropolis]|uniref:alpha/beta fold hydrolase n=1 Tax=Rhodococcus erythropolis TaxID=1833 RepID=UPI0021086242|nr:alpha/beta hydrolase [Rhodococcus erythropolis]MCQ4129025.1 alpha/beta hydrolase [Rhodococcus erythropolis]